MKLNRLRKLHELFVSNNQTFRKICITLLNAILNSLNVKNNPVAGDNIKAIAERSSLNGLCTPSRKSKTSINQRLIVLLCMSICIVDTFSVYSS